MKDYRIITNGTGTKFRVQQKGLWNRWHTMGWGDGYSGFHIHEFGSIEAAKEWLFKQHVNLVGPAGIGEHPEWTVAKP